jgi:hypothetical protein
MKTYIVYVDGIEVGMIKASGHNAAEKKAQKKHSDKDPFRVSVAYTRLYIFLPPM